MKKTSDFFFTSSFTSYNCIIQFYNYLCSYKLIFFIIFKSSIKIVHEAPEHVHVFRETKKSFFHFNRSSGLNTSVRMCSSLSNSWLQNTDWGGVRLLMGVVLGGVINLIGWFWSWTVVGGAGRLSDEDK